MKKRFVHSLKAITSLSLLSLLFFGYSPMLQAQGDAAAGEKLFINCAACHKPDKKVVGPALKGAQQRSIDAGNDPSVIYDWVRNSAKVAKENAYYGGVFADFGGQPMTSMPQLTKEDIDNIFAYVEAYQAPIIVDERPTTTAAEGDDNTMFWIVLLGIIFFILVRVLTGVKRSLRSLAAEKAGGVDTGARSAAATLKQWIAANKVQTALVVLVLVLAGATDGWYEAKEIGVFEGYAPEQPIAFSHSIHAGDNQIECVYCHHAAEKGKNAGIPPVNVCMNCHKSVAEGKREGGTAEIAKIYDAAGWDAEAGKYKLDENGNRIEKPIQWTRIHNLPDFAYFNHSQHYVVGQVKCQKCHGEVETFDYPMKQFAPLTMGWCIDCHRETPVQMNENGYYEKLHKQLTERYGDDHSQFTVEDIGGLECAKCHY